MKIIVASDIYGITPELKAFGRGLGEGVVLLSPWAGEGCPYGAESEAHAAFVVTDGLDAYAGRIAAAAGSHPVFLVGFSVGATAAWLYAADERCHPESLAVLYYGSRIRNYARSKPRCAVRAVFAEIEASFAPRDLAPSLAADNVVVQVVPGSRHGFMNPHSPGYAAALYGSHAASIQRELQTVAEKGSGQTSGL
jgi:dienelactone hydrolase